MVRCVFFGRKVKQVLTELTKSMNRDKTRHRKAILVDRQERVAGVRNYL